MQCGYFSQVFQKLRNFHFRENEKVHILKFLNIMASCVTYRIKGFSMLNIFLYFKFGYNLTHLKMAAKNRLLYFVCHFFVNERKV